MQMLIKILLRCLVFILGKVHLFFFDYIVNSQPRYGYSKPPHPKLYEIINKNRIVYKDYLSLFLRYKDYFTQISKAETRAQRTKPAWINDWITGLDAVAIYGILCLNNPQRYFEIGSGNSTKFARQAIRDHKLKTKITSFDPHP